MATSGTNASPNQACNVSTVHGPELSNRPDATHANPPTRAPLIASVTATASASGRHRPARIAGGTDRRTFSRVAASSAPPSTPWAVKTHAASGPPAFSDSSPVPAMATTSTASTRSRVAIRMTSEVCAMFASSP